MKNSYCILFMLIIVFLTNGFTSPQDTFKIDFRGTDFILVNISNDETHHVKAIRETNGQYYLPYMSRLPEFNNKFIVGYLSYDSLHSGWDSVFITVAVINPVTSVQRVQNRSATIIKSEIQAQKQNYYFTLRGCRLLHPAGMTILLKHNGMLKSTVFSGHFIKSL